MNEEIIINKVKISLFGSKVNIDKMKELLSTINITGDEKTDRLTIQNLIDKNKANNISVLYNGNIVWSFDKTIRDFKKILNNGMDAMTNHLYNFLSLETGNIAYFDKAGWINHYPTIYDLKEYFTKSQYFTNTGYNQPAKDFVPQWASDRKRIIDKMNILLNQID